MNLKTITPQPSSPINKTKSSPRKQRGFQSPRGSQPLLGIPNGNEHRRHANFMKLISDHKMKQGELLEHFKQKFAQATTQD